MVALNNNQEWWRWVESEGKESPKGLDGDVGPKVARADPNDPNHRSATEQGQCPEVAIVRHHDPSGAIRFVKDLIIRSPLPSLLLHVENVKTQRPKVRHDIRVNVLIREPRDARKPHILCSARGITRSCFSTSAAYRSASSMSSGVRCG